LKARTKYGTDIDILATDRRRDPDWRRNRHWELHHFWYKTGIQPRIEAETRK